MKSNLLPLLLGLCLLVPARVLTAQGANHNYARWEREIAAYERSDATNPPPKGVCVFIGSSTVRFWTTMPRDLAPHVVVNRGFGGSEIMDATYFADRIVYPYHPSMVFLRAGGNDLWAGKSVEEVFNNFKIFANTVHAHLPDADIVYIAQSPSIARWKQHEKEKALNELAHAFTQTQPWMHYIETYDIVFGADGKPRPELFRPDKLHFNADGYKLLTEQVLKQWPAGK